MESFMAHGVEWPQWLHSRLQSAWLLCSIQSPHYATVNLIIYARKIFWIESLKCIRYKGLYARCDCLNPTLLGDVFLELLFNQFARVMCIIVVCVWKTATAFPWFAFRYCTLFTHSFWLFCCTCSTIFISVCY